MHIEKTVVDGVSIIARIDEGKNRIGCMECLRIRLKKYLEFYGLIKPNLIPIEVIEKELDYFPYQCQAAITNIPGDHVVAILPIRDCPVCGTMKHPYRGISNYLNSYSKFPDSRGVRKKYRSVQPDEFIRTLQPFFGILGIATLPVEQKSWINGVYFYNCMQFLDAIGGYDVAGGKGNTQLFSIASCLGEAMERYFLTGVCNGADVDAPYDEVSDISVNPVEEWGFPAIDDNEAITEYSPSNAIGWCQADCLTESDEKKVLVPSDMIYSPPRSEGDVSNISFGSTNGAASGATCDDASTQSLMELIERDSYWYYMRSTSRPYRIGEDQLSDRILSVMHANEKNHYVFELMPNPFRVAVVQVLAIDEETGIQSRGTGAMFTLNEAIDRAFNECNQMLTSLRTGINVSDDGLDMRWIWFQGEATRVFPNIFKPMACDTIFKYIDDVSIENPLEDLLQRFRKQKLDVYRKTLVTADAFCVTKCIAAEIATTDATYYSHSDRLHSFADLLGTEFVPAEYSGTLFM